MRKYLAILVAGILMSMAMVAPAQAQMKGAHWRHEECRYRHLQGGWGWDNYEVRLTIACAVEHWAVPGGFGAAMCIAQHESGLNEEDVNSSSGAAGVYQWMPSGWPHAVARFSQLWHRWQLKRYILNARANVVAAIRTVHDGWSWSPWTTHSSCGV